ncbi:MAG: HNH endonuclease [Bacteriovoracaceae bacterium]
METINLHTWQDKNLLNEIKIQFANERNIGLFILKLMCEIEKRKCYASLGHSSLFQFLTEELKCSEGEAYRKIASAKLLKEFPSIAEKIEKGDLTTTNLGIISGFIKKTQETNKNKKLELIHIAQNKSKRELEKSLFELTGKNIKSPETTKQVSRNEVQLQITIDEKLLEKINKLKAIKNKSKVLSNSELLELLVEDALSTEEKKLEKLSPVRETSKKSRYIPAKIKKSVWIRAKGQCEWRDPKNNKSCNSKQLLQYDHIIPYAHGGDNSFNQIQLLCSTHNLHRGVEIFGLKKMKRG